MLRLLRLETRNLLRSRRGRGAAAALALNVFVAALLGGALAAQHRDAGRRDVLASRLRLEDAARVPTSSATPAKTAFDLAAWTDTFVARGVADAAIFTAGELAQLPDAAAIRIFEPPVMVPSAAERSPAALILGSLDIAWIVALILPLVAIVLGFDSVARDRERGTLAMLLAPAPSRWPLLAARALANFVVLGIGVLPALGLGTVLATFIGSNAFDGVSLAAAAFLLTCYAAFWSIGVTAVSAMAERVATALTASLAAWLIFAVAVPLAAMAVVRVEYPAPDPRPRLDGEQAAADVFLRPTAAILDREAIKAPELDPSKGVDGISMQNRTYLLLTQERLRIAQGSRFQEDRVLKARAELAEIAAWLSPATMVTQALAALAHSGPSERISFARDAELHRARVEALVRERVLANEAAFRHPEAWPVLHRSTPRDTAPAWVAGTFLLLSALVLGIAGAVSLTRAELAPTREDA